MARALRDDLVTFALGCSFSFEEALTQRHRSCATSPAGDGADVMHLDRHAPRPARSTARWWVVDAAAQAADAIRAIQITTRFPAVHGAPVHSASRS